MSYKGDIRLGDTIDFHFTTRNFSTGAPFTLGGVPVLSAYPANSTTELTAGITLDVDFDSRTGLNHVRVVASNGNGYATATDYSIVITTGTVNGVSVVGEVIGGFSIEHRSALMPATAARTLVVDAAGVGDSNVVNWKGAAAPANTGDAFARLGAPAGASVSADAAAIKSDTGTILTDVNTGAGAIYTRLGAPAGASIAADIAAVPAGVWATVMTGTTTAIQAMRGFLAAMLGKASGLDTNAPVYRNVADTKNVISATTDASGNRTAVTLDLA